jgi:uncharacterized protein YaaQ
MVKKEDAAMKLIYAIVRNNDSSKVTDSLNKKGFYVTKVASSGGFLRQGNTTLMVGTEDAKVEEVIEILKKECGPKQEIFTNPVGSFNSVATNVMTTVSGATVFVTDVKYFEKI